LAAASERGRLYITRTAGFKGKMKEAAPSPNMKRLRPPI